MDIVDKLSKALNTNSEIDKYEKEIQERKKANAYKRHDNETISLRMVELFKAIKEDLNKSSLVEYDRINQLLDACVYKKNKSRKKAKEGLVSQISPN